MTSRDHRTLKTLNRQGSSYTTFTASYLEIKNWSLCKNTVIPLSTLLCELIDTHTYYICFTMSS